MGKSTNTRQRIGRTPIATFNIQHRFNGHRVEAFATESNVWNVNSGALRMLAGSLGGDAVAVFHVDEMLPAYFEIQATITM